MLPMSWKKYRFEHVLSFQFVKKTRKIKKWNVDEKRNTLIDFWYENPPMGLKFPLRIRINFQIKNPC